MSQPQHDITNHKPIGDRVIVEAMDDSEYTSASGIVIVEHMPDLRYGKVIAVGPGEYFAGAFRSTTVQPGDVVSFYPHRSGESLHIAGVRYNVLRESTDIVTVIKQTV